MVGVARSERVSGLRKGLPSRDVRCRIVRRKNDWFSENQESDDVSAATKKTVKQSAILLNKLLAWPGTSGIQKRLQETSKNVSQYSSVRGIIDKGVRDVREVQARTSAVSTSIAATQTSISSAWTFPIFLVTYSTMVIAWASELAGSPYPTALCGAVGFVVGSTYSLAHRAATVRIWKQPAQPLNVVITGGTRGIGRALVREFLAAGDTVFVASRNSKNVRETVSELSVEWPGQIAGVECDVSSPSSVNRLASLAQCNFSDGAIDVWINNAGASGSFKPFLEATPEDLQTVTQTNLRGVLLCTRAAIKTMAGQSRQGHVFNMDGAGADGVATPNYAAYGATKAGIAHLMQSVVEECADRNMAVGVHTLSPGMVLTDLLLAGATLENKQVFNVLCEQPETAAAFLVPRVRSVAARQTTMAYIRFLTTFTALSKFLSAPVRLRRFFMPDGSVNYLVDEDERLDGRGAKSTARTLSSTRRRGTELQWSYAVSLSICVLLLSINPAATGGGL